MGKLQQATLDLLDAELRKKSSEFRNYPDDVRFKFYRMEFLIDPLNWEKFYPRSSRYNYNWKEFKFSDLPNLDRLIKSDDPGVYIFYIKPPALINDLPKFVLYVGISNRPLKERLKDYFNLSKIKKRENIHKMLQLYYDHIYVCYSVLSIGSTELSKLEKALHGFFYPIEARRDFPAELKKAQKAWGKI